MRPSSQLGCLLDPPAGPGEGHAAQPEGPPPSLHLPHQQGAAGETQASAPGEKARQSHEHMSLRYEDIHVAIIINSLHF